MLKKIAEIEGIRARLVKGGCDDALAKQKAGGKMTARERIAYLCDGGTFCEYDIFAKHLGKDYGLDRAELPADGVVTGFGKINGRGAFIYSQDFSVNAGTFGEMHGRKIRKTVELARKMGFPLIGINDSGGARVTEEMGALSAYGELFSAQIKASGAVPQIALIMGPVAGGQAYSPSLMDFIFMVEKTSHMFLAGPPLVKALVFQDATVEQLGGPKLHAEVTGVSDFTAKDDADCIERVKELLSYLPSNSGEMPPSRPLIEETGCMPVESIKCREVLPLFQPPMPPSIVPLNLSSVGSLPVSRPKVAVTMPSYTVPPSSIVVVTPYSSRPARSKDPVIVSVR